MRLGTSVGSTVLVGALASVLLLPACTKKAEEKPAPAPAARGGAAPAPAKAAAEPAKAAAEPAKAAAAPAAGCKLGDRVTGEVTLTKGCTLALEESVTVDEGGSLTIQPGVRLAFNNQGGIYVANGRLVAKGTAEAPIVLTSSAKIPAPGDWRGVDISDNVGAGTVLEHVVIEYAGRSQSGPNRFAALSIGSIPAGRVSVAHVTLRKNDKAGVYAGGENGRFVKFENNTFSNNPVSLHVHANIFGSVGAGNKFVDPIEVEGNVNTTQTWPAVDAPIIMTETMHVGGEKSAALLTLPEKATLKFAMSTGIQVGTDNGGGLVAKGVTFTSNNTPPNPGDWVGIIFFEKTVNSALDGCTIAYAGRDDGGGRGAITLQGFKPGPGLTITATTFKNDKQAAIHGPEGNCGDAAKPAAGNKAEGVPLCAKAE